MNSQFVILTSAGLRNIISDNRTGENEFQFIFGDYEFKTTNFFAEFISPAVSRLHQTDPTINSINFEYHFKDMAPKIISKIITEETISLFQKIMKGFSIYVDEEQSFKL